MSVLVEMVGSVWSSSVVNSLRAAGKKVARLSATSVRASEYTFWIRVTAACLVALLVLGDGEELG